MIFARLRSNIGFLGVEQLANYVLPLLVLPYLFRTIGPDRFGRIAFAQAFVAYAVTLTEYGFNWSATRRIAQLSDDRLAVSRVAAAVIATKAALMIASLLAIAVVTYAIPTFRLDWSLFAACSLAVIGATLFPKWLFQGLQRMKELVALSLAGRVVTLILIFALVRDEADYRLAAALLSANGVVAGIIAVVAYGRTAGDLPNLPTLSQMRETLHDGWHLFVSNVSITLYSNTNVFVLGLLAPPAVVGIFAAAEKVVRAVIGMLNPVSQASFPLVARLSSDSQVKALAFNRRLLRFQGVVSLGLTVILSVFAAPIVFITAGREFWGSIVLLQAMAALPFLIGISNVFGVQTMLNFGMGRQFTYILIMAGFLNLVLLLALIPRYQAMGAAMSVVLSEAAVTIAMAYLLQRRGLLRSLLIGDVEADA